MIRYHESSRRLLEPIGSVVEYEHNANQGNVTAVIESIRVNGFYGAVIAQASTGTLIAGHTRLKAMKALGADQIPVLWVDVGDIEAARQRIADNRTTRLGHDDPVMLLEELERLSQEELGLFGTGFDDQDKEILAALAESDPSEGDDDGEYAKQRSGHVCECPECGWTSDKARQKTTDDEPEVRF